MIEKFFKGKVIIKKLIIAIVFVFVFNFTFSYLGTNIVFATKGVEMTEDEISEEGGGRLLIPIQELILFLTDAVLQIFQKSFVSEYPITIEARAGSIGGWRCIK